MAPETGREARSSRPLDGEGFQQLVTDKLRPHYDFQGLIRLRMSAGHEQNLRELYRGRALYELLQNADDVRATRAAIILHPDGLAFLHDGAWFTVQDFENLALGWSTKDPDVCIGNKGLGFRSVLDITPSPFIFRIGASAPFSAKFSYALNKGHLDETLNREPALREEVRGWGPHRAICPIMLIPGYVRRRGLNPSVAMLLSRAAQGHYGPGYSTLFWLPANDPDIPRDVLRELGPSPLTLATGRDRLRAFLDEEVSFLIPYLQHMLEVRLYEENELAAAVRIPSQSRAGTGVFSVVTDIDGRQRTRSFFQVRTAAEIPHWVRDDPQTSRTLRAMHRARIAVSVEISDGRPVADTQAPFHVYFPTEERTGVGFVVHGDFYVKPDRTRLMRGAYNDWLFDEAAALAAGPLLTGLLVDYRARDVFEALRPVGGQPANAIGAGFVRCFGAAVQARPEPFIPTSDGSVQPDRVVLPPTVDEGGVWERLLGSELAHVRDGQRFLLPSEDSAPSRAFLDLAGVERLPASAFVDLVESASRERHPAPWWYACYQYMAMHPEISRWNHDQVAGRCLVPVSGGTTSAVPDDRAETILILPPRSRSDLLRPPAAFERMLRLVDPALAQLLWEGDEAIRTWVTSRFHISTFEVTDFLPRVVRGVAPQLFTRDGAPSAYELEVIWRFVRGAVEAAPRFVYDERFWDVIGRLPVPMGDAGDDAKRLPPTWLAPAFLAYWPDEWLADKDALAGVAGLRRIVPSFLDLLAGDDAREQASWYEFFERAGVSASPKVLRFGRIATGVQVPLTSAPPAVDAGEPFSGQRQQDENRVVLETLHAEGLWPRLAIDAPRCQFHPEQLVLSGVMIVEGLEASVAHARAEHELGDPRWHDRLRQLARELPVDVIGTAELATYCQVCQREITDAAGLLQLDLHHWVPSSFGPWSRDGAYLRLAGRRLIGLTPDREELGDQLLPYAVAETMDDYVRFAELGVAALDDVETASADTLLRFLADVGRALTDEQMLMEVVAVRARWRLARGAIQDVYRVLNRRHDAGGPPDNLRLAVRTSSGIRFRPASWHFAEPGSAIERAFIDRLNLIDVDRRYALLFRQLDIAVLEAGQSVREELVLGAQAQLATKLRDQIVSELAPFLLALIVGRSEEPRHAELVTRRLRERFSVRASPSLRLAIALADGSSPTEVAVEPFYLQRAVIEAEGARRDATYTLYCVGNADADLRDLDGDALGVALSPVFLEGLSEELAGLFPRVVARFQRAAGRTDEMEHFLLQQLGVTVEAQATAAELLLGEPSGVSKETDATPAPRIVLDRRSPSGDVLAAAREAALLNLQQTYQTAQEHIAARLDLHGEDRPVTEGRHGDAVIGQPVSREQQDRGLRGEEELKRRLQQSTGWTRFSLLHDRRHDGCGYDFLCTDGESEVKLEAKTFAPGGRVVVTLRELQEAHTSGSRYYLVGLCDDGGLPQAWQTFILQDPFEPLLRLGAFQLDTRVEVPSETLFAT